KGIPLRVEVGPRDVEGGKLVYSRRDQGTRDKHVAARVDFITEVPVILGEIQHALLERARGFRTANTHRIDSWDDFVAFFTPKNDKQPEIHGGFALCHFSGDAEAEEKARELKVTVRCIPLDPEEEEGRCVITGKPSKRRLVFAKAY